MCVGEGVIHRELREAWSMALGPRRGQCGDGHWLGLATSFCCARGSQSHIKKMLQLVLNWEVSQATVRTGMICGAQCGPTGADILEAEKQVSRDTPEGSD